MSRTSADLLLYNARVITLDERQPAAELVAIGGNRIIGVGGRDCLKLYRGTETRLIDCEGRTVVPGFIDAHCHPFPFATTLLYVNCSPSAVKDIAGIQTGIRLRAEQTPVGKWVRAAQYNEAYLAERRHPDCQELDRAASHHPVILIHYSGSICVLNSLALRLIGITRQTPDPQGGRIGRDQKTGEPDGLIVGRNELVEKGVPPLDEEELAEGVKLACREYLSYGITSLHDTTWSNGFKHWQIFQRLKEHDLLPVRISMLTGCDGIDEFKGMGLSTGTGDDHLRLGGVKIALDESTGHPHPPQKELDYYALKAHEAGFQLAFHVSDIYTLEAALTSLEFILHKFPRPDHRHRLEHCAICPPGLLDKVGKSGAVIVTQPPFLYYLGGRYMEAVPSAQLGWIYPLRSFQKRGLRIAASSDSPVVPLNPLMGIYAAVTRKVEKGQFLAPWEGVSPVEALKMYTIEAAYASFDDPIKGTIAPGKLADLAVLSDNPLQIEREDIKEIKVMLTVLDGKVVWERP
jgi:predicted amidohydrolase YtcJ